MSLVLYHSGRKFCHRLNHCQTVISAMGYKNNSFTKLSLLFWLKASYCLFDDSGETLGKHFIVSVCARESSLHCLCL